VQLIVGWNVQPWIGALQWSPDTGIANNLRGILGVGAITGGNPRRSKTFDFPPLPGSKSGSSS
jgi:hypothetical protein